MKKPLVDDEYEKLTQKNGNKRRKLGKSFEKNDVGCTTRNNIYQSKPKGSHHGIKWVNF